MFVADTHALVWYILRKAPLKVRNIFKDAENNNEVIYIPTIALAEMFHAIIKERIRLDYEEALSIIQQNPNYKIIGFDYSILKEFVKIKGFDLHDNIIVATAKFLDATLITKDEDIIKSKIVKTIW